LSGVGASTLPRCLYNRHTHMKFTCKSIERDSLLRSRSSSSSSASSRMRVDLVPSLIKDVSTKAVTLDEDAAHTMTSALSAAATTVQAHQRGRQVRGGLRAGEQPEKAEGATVPLKPRKRLSVPSMLTSRHWADAGSSHRSKKELSNSPPRTPRTPTARSPLVMKGLRSIVAHPSW
jgi:hypothetical protein